MRTKKRIVALGLALIFLVVLGGCGKEENSDIGASGELVTLKWWTRLFPHVAQTATSFSEVPLYQELAKLTGLNIEFIHPTIGQETESFNIMLASGELPDIIQHDMTTYKGGIQKAIDDGVIIELDKYLDKAVNYKKVLSENPEWDKQVMTDSGKHFTFASINGNDLSTCWQGLQIRSDLLNEAGLPMPETIEDWDKTLRAFKDMEIEYPLTLTGTNQNSAYSGAFGIGERFYQENGVVKFGPLEENFKRYLEHFKGWYKDGLLDPDYFAQDGKTFNSKITSGKAGAYFAPVGGGMGVYLPVLKETNSNYELAGTKFPVMHKGEKPKFGAKSFEVDFPTSVFITSKCKDIDAAVRLLDYGYSKEGHMLYNFGIEGTSYNMVNDYPKFTDEVLKNSSGLTVQHAMAKYIASVYGGPFVSDPRYFEQYIAMPQQQEAVKNWADHDDSSRYPNVSFTEEESAILFAKQTAVNTYLKENVLNFITGKTSLTEYDKFVEKLKSMGMDEILVIYQAALDRYNAR